MEITKAYPNVAESPQCSIPITRLVVIQSRMLESCVHGHLHIAHVVTDEVHFHMVSVVCCCSECRGPPGFISVIVEDAKKSCSCCGEQPSGMESMLSIGTAAHPERAARPMKQRVMMVAFIVF